MKNFFLKQLVVWLLIAIGLIAFFIFLFVIGSNKQRFFSPVAFYKTILKDSSGIYVGTKVSIHGKNTGNISKMILLPEGEIELYFSVQKKHIFSLTESSFIEIKTAGALGDRYINVNTPDLSAKQLKKGSLIPYKKSSTLLSLLTGSGKDTKKSIQNILKQIDGVLNQLNKKGLGILSESNQKDLTQILKSTKNILQKVESGEGTLGALVNDPSLYNRLLLLLGKRPTKSYLQDLSKKSHSKKK